VPAIICFFLEYIITFINDANCIAMADMIPWLLKVMELDLLSLDSVARFAEAWNARMGPLHVLINNAGIFSIGGSYFKCNFFPLYVSLFSNMFIRTVSGIKLTKLL
jgi:NAD(P)-dependent dehydrogenase (short-subunit alcohol dehydrogenase family)